MNKISLFLAMFLFSGIANAEMLNSKHIYSFAKSGDYRSLERYSRWIDITNSDGDTAVCLAIKNNDVNSYNLLLNYGANSRPSCYAKAIKNISGSAKSGTFLGMSGAGWAVTGGVLAAGGIAAAAGGGGGGGSSSSQPSPVICNNQGSLVEGVCQCNAGYTGSQCETCDDGYTKYNGSCYKKLACEANKHQEANSCVCDNNYIEQDGVCYQKLSCMNGSQKENECVCDAGYAGSLCSEADENHIIGSDGNLYDKLNCVNGNQVNASCICAEGWEGATCETAAACGYDTIECAYGYKESGSTCKSGDTTYKECVFDDEHFIQQGGNVYPKLDCKNGGVQEANTCNCAEGWKGENCETAADCGYNTIECAYGYEETGSTCKSGDTTYKECVFDDEHFIQQDGNVYPKLECKNGGEQTGAACTGCNEGWEGTLCDKADSNHIIGSDGNLYDKLNCVNGVQNKDICVCNTGYAGILCNEAAEGYILFDGVAYPKLSCVNGEQNKDKCVCNSGWGGTLCDEADENHIIGSDGNLYDKLNCVNGNQVNASCNCTEGWKGATCETAAACGYNTIECAYGYKETGSTCKSGDTTYKECVFDDEHFIQQGGNVYPKLDCKNGGVQEANTCNCAEGWKGENCETAADCGYNTIECAYGYEETGSTCKSGDTTYKECVFDDEHFIQQGGNVYPKLDCKNGGVQEANTCNCVEGWTGTLCDTPVDCGANYKETCASNEYTTEETCTSGGNNLKKCLVHSEMPNCQTLSSTSDTCEICKTGYAGTTCSQAADGYTLFDDIAYPTLACANGSTQDKDHCTCEDGWTGTLCNTPAYCDYTTTSCLTGYKTTGNSCKSGEAIYVECVFDDENFIQQDGNVYPKLDCKNGGTQLGNSCNCSKGYSGTFCQTVCNTVDEDGNCIKVITTNKTNKSTIKATNNDKSITLYGMKGEVYAYNAYGDTKGDSGTNGTITLINKNAGDVYGMYSGIYATNTHVGYPNNISGLIDIKNTNSGNVYGIYSDGQGVNVEGYAAGTYDTGIIRINNVNSGDAYGIYVTKSSGISANYAANSSGGGLAIIEITNRGNNNIYGIYSGDTAVNNGIANGYGGQGIIKVNNIGNGDIYGIFAEYSAYNTNVSKNSHYTGTIKIKNQGNGKVYGISAEYSENNSNNLIQIISNGITNSYGMYGTSYNRNFGTIQIVQNDNGLAVGQYGSGYILNASYTSGRIYNKGTIKIYNLSNGVAVGIYANYANVENLGDIIITRADFTDDNLTDDTSDDITYSAKTEKGGTAIGIYGTKGSTITNSGTITINNAANAYGIWSEGGTVTNTGTITIDGESQTNDSSANGKHIVLNGGTLFQDGKLVAKQTADTASSSSDATSESKKTNNYVLNLDDMGGKVVATEKAVFEVHGAIAGHLTMSSDIVSKGFKDTYTTNGTIDAEDTSGLCLVSQSALFNASLAENNSDVVMKMKAFNEVVDNKSLAGFLQNNYALENNESFFNTLKKQETVTSLNDALGDLSGKKLFSRFADEDLTMMRELTFDVNNKLFMNNDDHLETSGNVSTFNFSSNKGSDNRYALISQDYGNYQLGLNYGFANVRSDDDDNNRRNERMFHVGMPISYGKQGFKFITTPHLGYSSGTYNRKGFNNENYEGNVEKTMFGLVNEARYPFALGKWTIAPATEFNVVDYRTQGHEKGGTYKLRLAAQNNYSVEAGVGLYANAEHKFSEKSKLTFTNGLTMYHEFADPYKTQVGVCGMSGEFDIRDEKRGYNRTVIRTGLSYVNDNISLSGNVMSYIDKEYRTNATLDFKYAF